MRYYVHGAFWYITAMENFGSHLKTWSIHSADTLYVKYTNASMAVHNILQTANLITTKTIEYKYKPFAYEIQCLSLWQRGNQVSA